MSSAVAARGNRKARKRSRRETASLAIDGCTNEELGDWLRTHYLEGLVGIARDQPADPWLAGGSRYRLHFDAPLNEVEIELSNTRVPCSVPRLRDNFLVLVRNRG